MVVDETITSGEVDWKERLEPLLARSPLLLSRLKEFITVPERLKPLLARALPRNKFLLLASLSHNKKARSFLRAE